MRTFLIWLYIALLVSVVNAEVPQEGLKAEMQKRWSDAISTYEKVLKKSPKRSDLYLRIADIHSSQKRYTEAADALKKAISIEPKRALYYKKLSEVYAVLNKPKEAMSTIKKALKLEPKNKDYLIAHAKLAIWNKKHLEAISSLKKLLERSPKHKEASFLLARSYEWSGLFEEALIYYNEHLKKDPDDLQSRLNLADIKEFYGDINSANKTLEEWYNREYPAKKHLKEIVKSAPVDVPVLLYHCIDEKPQNEYWIETDEFEAQMQFLRKNNYTSISTKDVHDYTNYGAKLPPNPVVITFDDGCENLYTKAYPILRKNNLTAEIYLIVDSVVDIASERQSSESGQEANKLGEMGETSLTAYLTWPEIKEMSDNGIIFGSHSASHPMMSELDDINISYELLYSKLAIKANTGKDASSFAYPYGDGSGDKDVHKFLKKYGFITAVAAEGGIAKTDEIDFFNIPRVNIYGAKPSLDVRSKGVSVVADKTRLSDSFSAKLNPNEAEIQYELCNRYAALKEHKKALVAIDRAVELDPENFRYLNRRIYAAGAAERPDIALESALRAYSLDPENDEILLRLARASVWSNHLDYATKYYKTYIRRHQDEKEVYIEHAQAELWRGGYSTAMNILETYQEKFGEDDQYLMAKAELLTWANTQTKAFPIIDDKLEKDPNHYSANFLNTVALKKDGHILESIESLKKTEGISPESQDSIFLRKYIMTDYRSSVRAGMDYYLDSDNLSTLSGEVEGKYFLSPLTNIFAIWHTDYTSLTGDNSLSFAKDNGSKNAIQNSLRIGISHRLSSELVAKLSAGVATADSNTDPVYGLNLSYAPIDELMIDLTYDHHYLTITPKTIGRGTVEDSFGMSLYWEPSYTTYVNFSAGYDMSKDDFNTNDKWSVEISPKLVVLRRQNWNFDIGVSASAYGYDKESQYYDLGYYAPKWYQAYYLVGLSTWKINSDDSVNIAMNAGKFKDSNMNTFIFGGGIHIEGVFGLYKDWMLKASIGGDYSARYYDESYKAVSSSLYITKRF